ncbi:MAG: hypothetical protein R3B81_14505 [bacterium]
MNRLLPFLTLAGCLLLAAPRDAGAVLIDSFETGNYSLSFNQIGSSVQSQQPNPAHVISQFRSVALYRFTNSVGPISSSLTVAQGSDDDAVVTFPTSGDGQGDFAYSNGDWDLTDNGQFNRISVRVSQSSVAGKILRVELTDVNDEVSANDQIISSASTYHFPLDAFAGANVRHVRKIRVILGSNGGGGTVGIANIETTNGSSLGLHYDAWTPLTIYPCPTPRGGEYSLAWGWQINDANQSTFSGPLLSIDAVSGNGCQAVAFSGYDSQPAGGQYGDMAFVSVDWQSATFDDAFFELSVTPANPAYFVDSLDPPTVFETADGFVVEHRLHLGEIPGGVNRGIAYQRIAVTPVPGQELWFDSVTAQELWNGYSLSFHVTGGAVDTGQPLFEIAATGAWTNWLNVTDVDVADAADGDRLLRAIPTITRAGTRLELARPAGQAGTVDVYDVHGRHVIGLPIAAGARETVWDGRNVEGRPVAAGVYLARYVDASGQAGVARVVTLR